MNIPFVDLNAQYLTIKDEIDDAIRGVIAKSAFVGGPYVESFESAFAAFCGVKHCIGVGNGTDALYIALKVLGIDKGDEVITAANSFIATSEAITMARGKVVFADIDPRTYNLDPSAVEAKITQRTKAIIAVHLYGQPADMDRILALAQEFKLKVVEDAAQAHGALYKGRKIGSIGDMACFSFYPGKNLGAYGDGGAIVTDSDDIALKVRMFANHGRILKYDHEIEGVNSRLDGLQAAILEVKLRHLPNWTRARIQNARLYSKYLNDTKVIIPFDPDNVQSVYHLYVIRIKKELLQCLRDHMRASNISTGIHYPIALPNLKAYSYLNHTENDFPEASRASQEILSLPMYPELTEEQIRFISTRIREFLGFG